MPEIIVKLGDRVVQKYLLYKDQKMTVGRAPDNDIALENPAVSRRHSTIQMVNGRYIIEDNNSANGTYVNGVRVTRTEILDKDVITIGKHKLHFYNETGAAAASPAPEEKPGGSTPVGVLRITQGKQREQVYELGKPETRIGRAADNDIRLQDWFVSKHHAVISRKSGVYSIRDLDSWRHTMVNGEPIQEAVLTSGDEIQFGPKITMRFEFSAAVESRAQHSVEDEAPQLPAGSEDTGGAEAPVPAPAQADFAEPAPDTSAFEAPPAPVEPEPEPAAETEPQPEPVSDESAPEEESSATEPESEPEPVAVAASNGSHAEAEAQAGESAPAPASQAEGGEALTGEAAAEVAMWEKALANPSKVIRKQAARKLKQLTGRDYDID